MAWSGRRRVEELGRVEATLHRSVRGGAGLAYPGFAGRPLDDLLAHQIPDLPALDMLIDVVSTSCV